MFLKRRKGSYVVAFYEGEYFRQPASGRVYGPKNAVLDDPLYEPLRKIGVDEAGIRRLFKQHTRGLLQRWIRITDAAMHDKPRGFPGFKASPAAFLVDAVQHNRMPPDWSYAHDKEQERLRHEQERATTAADQDAHRLRYEHERAASLEGYCATREGSVLLASFRASFLVLYRAVDPQRCEEAARTAALGKIEREHFHFPEFGVWLLEQRQADATT